MSTNENEATRDFDKDEEEIHSLFAHLRDEVVRVSAQFRQRVKRSVGTAVDGRSEAPTAGGLLTSVLVQSLNLLAHALGNDPSNEEDEP